MRKKNKGFVGGIVLAIVIAICLIVGFCCAKKVPAGYVGIVYSMNGGISDDVLTQGWHIVSPTKEVTSRWRRLISAAPMSMRSTRRRSPRRLWSATRRAR